MEDHEVNNQHNNDKVQDTLIDSSLEDKCQKANCIRLRNEILTTSTNVQRLLKALNRLGCNLTPNHFRCLPCNTTAIGAFQEEQGIILCQNHLLSKAEVENTLVHELVHVYDWFKYKLDWTHCKHHACTEIRAANLSGDCSILREFRKTMKIKGQHQECVRRRAIQSLRYNPYCTEDAEQAVNQVFQQCYEHYEPFEKPIYL